MPDEKPTPCRACGRALEPDVASCPACGAAREGTAPSSSAARPAFELEDASGTTTPRPETGAASKPPGPPPAPATAAARPEASPAALELEADPVDDAVGEEEPEDDGGGDTIRMPFAEVVQAWAEDAEDEGPATDRATPASAIAGLPRKPILVLVGIVALIVLAIALL